MVPRAGADPGELLERAGDLEALRAGLRRAREGEGELVVVEGVAGIGKSALLDVCASAADRDGMSVLRVRGDELVMESSFAAVRELFWPEVRELGTSWFEGASSLALPVFEAASWDGSDRDRASSVLHGLYWLTADLAERRPLLLVVDDAQWLDAASARFVVYLARRVDALPALLVVALRSGELSAHADLRRTLSQWAGRVLRPSALSEEASAHVVRRVLGARADDDLCRFCHEATRGNPFYLRGLAAALAEEGGRPTVELAARVRSLGVEAISAGVLVRLAHLGDDCQRLAEALSVLGPDSSLRLLSALAELSRDTAQRAADRLHERQAGPGRHQLRGERRRNPQRGNAHPGPRRGDRQPAGAGGDGGIGGSSTTITASFAVLAVHRHGRADVAAGDG